MLAVSHSVTHTAEPAVALGVHSCQLCSAATEMWSLPCAGQVVCEEICCLRHRGSSLSSVFASTGLSSWQSAAAHARNHGDAFVGRRGMETAT
jgi:hypothetical protein